MGSVNTHPQDIVFHSRETVWEAAGVCFPQGILASRVYWATFAKLAYTCSDQQLDELKRFAMRSRTGMFLAEIDG